MRSTQNWYLNPSVVKLGRVLAFCIVFFFFFKLNYWEFILGNWSYFHDSLVPLAPTHLFYDRLFNGQLPLWNPYLNAGTPLWPTVEAFASFDLIALFSWGVAVLFHQNSLVAWQLTCFLWMFFFSMGGMLLSKRQVKNDWIQFCVFFILFGGPIAAAIRAQVGGFLLPFRYLPWVLLFYGRFRELPNFKNTLLFCLAIILNQSGFQNAYWMLFAVFYALIFEVVYCRDLDRQRVDKYPRKQMLSLVGLALLGYLASLVAGLEMLKLHALTREFHPHHFIFPWKRYAISLVDFKSLYHARHGSGFMSLSGLLFFTWGIVYFFKRKKDALSMGYRSSMTLWLSLFGGTLIFTLGGIEFYIQNNNTFLGLRNWGFLLTLAVLCQTQIFALGTKVALSEFRWFKKHIDKGSFLIFVVLSLELYFYSSQQLYFYSLLDNKTGQSIVPKIALTHPDNFFKRRIWDLDFNKFIPYHLEVPGIWKIPTASIGTLIQSRGESEKYLNNLTHIFQTESYQKLRKEGENLNALKKEMGVSADILSLVSNGSPPLFQYKILDFHSGNLDLLVSSHTSGRLIYLDSIDPYWRAYVDGKTARLEQVNGFAKGLDLEAGAHRVKFSYEPRLYIFSFFARYITIFALSTLLFWDWLKEFSGVFKIRRPKPREIPLCT